MNPEDEALEQLGSKMGRGRFMDRLDPDEQTSITIIISPGGEPDGDEAVEPDLDDMG